MGGIAIVDGHPGSGKTTLIQRLLESNKSRSIQASRCLAKPHSGTWKEEQLRVSGKTASRHKELRRYLDAGASDSTLLTYDPGKTDIYSLLSQADAGLGAWDEWVLEAENDGYSGAHCSVFVLRPLAESARLVERKERIVCHIPLEEYLRHAGVKLLPGESLKPLGHLSEDVDIDLPSDEHLAEKLAQAGIVLNELKTSGLRTMIRDGVPIWSKKPELRPECSRLLAAEVVVINLHHAGEWARGEATRAQILDLYRNWKLRYKLDLRSQVTRAGVYLANLQETGNPDTQKALAQIKRKLRGR